jgi:phospholipid-binding lipoprotein MlaA
MIQNKRLLLFLSFIGYLSIVFPVSAQEFLAEPINTSAPPISLESQEMQDPFEGVNRAIFSFNQGLDTVLINPLAHIYRYTVPDFMRLGVSNAIDNLWAPLTVINHSLQGKPASAVKSLFRFLINSTIGFFGCVDVAESLGLSQDLTNFGQTLASWGVTPGPYIVLPIIGPSSMRDFTGRLFDFVTDPTYYVIKQQAGNGYNYVRWTAYLLTKRDQSIEAIDSLKETSIDLYVTMRSLYQQYQDSVIHKNQASKKVPGPEAFIDDTTF